MNDINLTALKTFSEAPVDVSTVTPKAFTPTSSFEGKQLWFWREKVTFLKRVTLELHLYPPTLARLFPHHQNPSRVALRVSPLLLIGNTIWMQLHKYEQANTSHWDEKVIFMKQNLPWLVFVLFLGMVWVVGITTHNWAITGFRENARFISSNVRKPRFASVFTPSMFNVYPFNGDVCLPLQWRGHLTPWRHSR